MKRGNKCINAEKRRIGLVRRLAAQEQLRAGGTQTAAQVHAVIGGDFDDVRNTLYRMVKAGYASSVRGTDINRNSTFSLGQQHQHKMIARDVGMPFRPVLKEWELNSKRDPLVSFLFGAPPALQGTAIC